MDDPVEREHRLRDPLVHLGVADARQRRLQGQARGEQLLDHLVVPLMGEARRGGRVVRADLSPNDRPCPTSLHALLHYRPWRGTRSTVVGPAVGVHRQPYMPRDGAGSSASVAPGGPGSPWGYGADDDGLRAPRGAAGAAGGVPPGELDGLPEPVLRYLTAAVAPGTPLARTARIRMHGTIRIGRWLPFRGDDDVRGYLLKLQERVGRPLLL